MRRFQWEAQQIGITLGMMGFAGLIMLLAASMLYFGVVKSGKQEIIKIRNELALLQSHPKLDRQYTPADDLALFYDFFPAREALAEQLRMVHHIAANKKLFIEHVDYKISKIQETPLVRYQISFSLNTDYVSLRHYIADVLKALPNAALENIELQRMNADEDVLDEKISFALYFQESH